ncbi:MAG: sigma-54-dependent Fis family transcriptional regulator [Bacteroidales bacterium]|nr:sigma-54-dependent Fis family transcriptional regulator [Bacteroidales bacterium]MBR1782537.1 sigma-54-dependent Fis family transcriptional regulator [Bacteroidales bacterium]MBR1783705.1 sigma-54-dependent Fis family transcriptional regulator [Bacteroidales bacterium]
MDLQALKNKYDIIGNDPALNEALETAVKFAPTGLSVLIQGESGVGKENVARIIHQYSARRQAPFFVVNCGALPKELVNSELFGHVKGSFTGAVDTRKGYFEEADGGTLFLDEIAELPPESQALLLRVLQSGEYRKVGSNKVEHTDVRIVAATNVHLYEAVKRGKFREDLYFRLSAAQIRIPALRERKSDIYLLFRKFTSDFSEVNGMCKISLKPDAIRLLEQYRWPGNVRQLQGFTQSLTAQVSQKVTPTLQRIELSAQDLMPLMPREEGEPIPMLYEGPQETHQSAFSADERQAIMKAIFDLKQEVDSLKARLDRRELPPPPQPALQEEAEWQGQEDFQPAEEPQEQPSLSIRRTEDELIRQALEKYHGNRKKAAEELGMSERTLYRKLPPEYRKK